MREHCDPFDVVPTPSPGVGLYGLDADRVLVVTPSGPRLVTGRGEGEIVALIDGQRSTRDIAAQLASRVSTPQVLFALDRLQRSGWTRNAALGVEPVVPPDIASVLAEFGLAVDPAADRRVGLVDQGAIVGDGDAARRWVEFDAARRAAERPWLPARFDGARWWIGPTLGATDGPCWQCLRHRRRLHMPVRRWLVEQGHPLPTPIPPTRDAVRAALAPLASALQQWARDEADPFAATLVAVGPGLTAPRRHRVVRRPQCPGCGTPDLVTKRGEAPITLASRPVAFSADGGHRIEPPDATWTRLQHHVSPLTGVVASLGPLPGRDHPLRPVWAAVSPVCPREPAPSAGAWRQISMGKGAAAHQARASVLGEAIERYAVYWQGDEARHRATAVELGDDAVGPDALQGFSLGQLERPGPIAPGTPGPRGMARVPEPCEGGTPLWWTPAWSLTTGRRRWLPTAWCYRQTPFADDRRFVIADSNGRAAGNCLEEAILQGFLELVERDAAAIWWYNRVSRPAFDLDAFDLPGLPALRRHYAEQGWRFWTLDLTTDLGIPVCVALARDDADRWCIGLGCHLDARLAISRALAELGQLFDPSPHRLIPWDPAAMPSTDFLMPDSSKRSPADHPLRVPDDLRHAVELCVERATHVGLETIVLDLTRPDIDLSVALVAVPGLRHFWPRFAPGRLYSVPVEMGWRATALTESMLNPAPLIL